MPSTRSDADDQRCCDDRRQQRRRSSVPNAAPKTSATTLDARRGRRRRVGQRAAQLRRVAHERAPRRTARGRCRGRRPTRHPAPPSSPRGPEWSRCPLARSAFSDASSSARKRSTTACAFGVVGERLADHAAGEVEGERAHLDCAATTSAVWRSASICACAVAVMRAASDGGAVLRLGDDLACRPHGRPRGSRPASLRASASWAVYSSSAASRLAAAPRRPWRCCPRSPRSARRAASSCVGRRPSRDDDEDDDEADCRPDDVVHRGEQRVDAPPSSAAFVTRAFSILSP